MINYYLLTKPGIIMGNLITFAAGFFLAIGGGSVLFLTTFLGLGFIIASACILNNYIDRFSDQKMERTKKRALAEGSIKVSHAMILAGAFWVLGTLLLAQSNLLTLLIANLGFLIYVFLYTPLKSKTHYSTLIGSVAGAIPPVVGYTAVTNQLDFAAFLLFITLILWQMPHFFAISLWHFEDYSKANLPLLPMVKGIERTKIEMLLYIIALIPTLVLFTYFKGYAFLAISLLPTGAWLYFSLKGFQTDSHQAFGKQMFRWSLVTINVICLLLIV